MENNPEEPQQSTEPIITRSDNQISNEPPKNSEDFNKEEAFFEVSQYSPICEEIARIKKIIPLKKSCCKFALFIILNIITVCIIDLFIAWFPQMNLGLRYSKCSLNEATHLGIYGQDEKLVITELIKVAKPKSPSEDVFKNSFIQRFNMNIDYTTPNEFFLIFKFRLFDYILNYETHKFEALHYSMKTTQEDFQNTFVTGLEQYEIDHLKEIFGICDIDIQIHSVLQILLEELTDPFYLFQLYSIILWYCNEYEYYSSVIVVLTVISLILSVYETRKNLVALHEMSRYSCQVNIYRKDQSGQLVATNMSSQELVPGDLYEIPDEGNALPCDTILVKGTVIVNESMLTGESTPIVKQHMPAVDVDFDTDDPNCDKYFLYAGTKVVQKRSISNIKVLGVVYSTGFKTIKGNLIRQILFPKETDEQFKRDSGKYIIFMGCLCLVGFFICLKFLIDNAGLEPVDIVLKFLDLITTTVPPSLPACISVGITYSIGRLKKQKIFCIARERINIAGKVNIICFDKTGTLTEDHLDIFGYIPVKTVKGKFFFEPFKNTSSEFSLEVFDHYKTKNLNSSYNDKNKDLKQLYVECLACCHGNTYVNGKLIGDPIDVKMFEGVGWELKENTSSSNEESKEPNDNYDPLISSFVRPKEEQDLNYKLSHLKENENEDSVMKTHYEIGIVRRFDFVSKLQRMTTLGKNVNEKYFKAYCKGSPEKIKELCKADTIPENFNEILASYTSKGYRVLAMATKAMKMNFTQSQQVLREFVESNMIFLGLLIVRNMLKEVTPITIKELDNADIRMVMATGDNILTAISVSRECGLVQNNAIIYSCNIDKDEEGKSVLIWNKVENFNDNDESKDDLLMLNNNDAATANSVGSRFSSKYPPEMFNDTMTTKISNNRLGITEKDELVEMEDKNEKKDINDVKENVSLQIKEDKELEKEINYFIAITGTNFEQLSKLNKKYLENKDKQYLSHHITFRQILKNGVIFARMAPEHKALLVESFREEQFTVLMCGDGANDCAALRSADIGVSLSPEEASIAAHFTSQIPDISCIIKLLKEGKCSLTTSIQTFKYMMLYSLIQFLAVNFLLIYQSYLTDFQFLASDLFIIFPLAIFIAGTAPYELLTHHYPNSSLLSFPVITSIVVQTIFSLIFQLGGRLVLKNTTGNWYGDENACSTEGDDVTPCDDNSVIFLISNMQYLTTAIAFSVSKPFRKPIYTNWLLMIYLIAVIFYSIWITINCDDWSLNLFGLVEFKDDQFKYWVFLVICINFVLSVFFEWVITPFVNRCWDSILSSRQKNRVLAYDEKLCKGEEYTIYEYQRMFYAERRRIKEEKE